MDCQLADQSFCGLDKSVKSRCGLDDSQSLSGQLVAWTAGGLVKLLIRSTHGLNDSWIVLPAAFEVLYNFSVTVYILLQL